MQEIEAVKELLPAARHGALLFTLRQPTLGTFAEIIRLERMTKEEGIHFLLRRANQRLHHSPIPPLEGSEPSLEYAAAAQHPRLL